ncbi:MAG: SDR family oxidoreductase [Clostridiales bacterium]|jgi:3-oxoacyl-[acyl-carrier protein] reductase|nr:SDR family oxidoreductase [Clostridiales bacterium]
MQKVLVTGASVGIGRETAVAFAKQGARVAINYNSSEAEARETLRLVEAASGRGFLVKADVSDEAAATALIREAARLMDGLNVLVNNAGITRFIPFDDLDAATADIWDVLYKTNVESIFFCCREAAKVMPEGSCIVNLASVSGMLPRGSSIPYSVSKAAIIHLTKCLANVLSPKIRVNSVSPGVIQNTRWNAGNKNFNMDQYQSGAEAIPMKRLGEPGDIASAILYLASERSGYITGVNLPVEGGMNVK